MESVPEKKQEYRQAPEEKNEAAKETIIDVQQVSVYYGSNQAVNNVSFDIPEKSVTGLIGPSGCGKSTFLRSVNRMNDLIPIARTEGEIVYDGVNILSPQIDVTALRSEIGMVFQKPNPYSKSIYENIVHALRLKGIRKKSVLDEIVEDSLKQAALWDEVKDRLKSSAMSLSGGQQQRLCIARTLALKPDVILLDEPAASLDPISSAKIEELVLQLKEKYTLLIVTHNMEQAARISNQTAFFYNGRLVEYASTNKLFTNPNYKETEDYISGRFS